MIAKPFGGGELIVVEKLDDLLAVFLDLEADRVTLEWTSGGIEVTTYKGSTGVGGVLADPVAKSIVEEVVARAKLEERTSGSLEAEIRGRQMKFIAKEYDHFGETAFEIRVSTAEATRFGPRRAGGAQVESRALGNHARKK